MEQIKGTNIKLYNEDCINILKQYPAKYFDLAIIDPPYGIGESGQSNHSRGKLAKAKKYKDYTGEDKEAPDANFFDLLNQKCKNFIIFGANHFIDNIPFNISSPCWIIWDKNNYGSDFADAELALTSFKTATRIFKYTWNGMLQGDMKNKELRIHPNQKPVSLYDWIYKNYAQKEFKIIDTHLGSGSNAISANFFGVSEFVGIELDKHYYTEAKKRIELLTRPMKLNFY